MTIVVVLVLLGSVADTKASSTNKLSISNETQSLSDCYATSDTKNQVNVSATACNITVDNWYPTGDWRISEGQCNLDDVIVQNGTEDDITLNTDYKLFADEGVIQFLNTSETEALVNNNSFVDYNFCGTGYFTSSGDRALANLWTTLGIIALLIITAGVAYRYMNNKD